MQRPVLPTQPIDTLFFDLGNTLIHFEGAWPEVMKQADAQLLAHLKEEGFELDREAFLIEFRARLTAYYIEREAEFIEHTTAQVLRALLADLGYPGVGVEQLRPALRGLYAASQAHWKREEDTLPTLQALRDAGYRMAVISNAGDDEDVQTLVDNAGIRPFFEQVLSSAACGIRKPNPRIFELALVGLGAQPAQAAMVGDTLGADILGAKNAGLYAVWLTRRADTPGNRDHDDTIQPDASIQTLAELPQLLEGLQTRSGPDS